MTSHIDKCREEGISFTDGGGRIVSIDDMYRMADAMIRILQEEASLKKLPASVLAHFQSLACTKPKPFEGGQSYLVGIYFEDDLSRLSLKIVAGPRKGQRTGEGIENIVSLFDTGYNAGEVVYGEWTGHEDAGAIPSRTSREELHFIRDAVERFNMAYGKLYSVQAYISLDTHFYAV